MADGNKESVLDTKDSKDHSKLFNILNIIIQRNLMITVYSCSFIIWQIFSFPSEWFQEIFNTKWASFSINNLIPLSKKVTECCDGSTVCIK